LKICSVNGCNNKYRSKGYCNKHYLQIKRYGHPLDRTQKDKNRIIIKEGYAEIEMYNRNNKITGYTKIDLDDVERIRNIKWSINHNGYVYDSSKKINLARLIINLDKYKNYGDIEVDHRNRDPLDNRKSNLRKVNRTQNVMNRSIQSNNNSGFIGVFYRKREKLWYSTVKINKKTIVLGSSKAKEDMINLRKKCNKILKDLVDKNPMGVITREMFNNRCRQHNLEWCNC